MNLIHDPWIPVDRLSGPDQRIAPWEISDVEDPVLRLAAPRPDFNGALLQFLTGLLQTTCAPNNDDQWAEWLESSPSPEILKERFEFCIHAFELDGDGPRFLQDFDSLDGDEKPIDSLLIDAPGAQTLKQNADHFIKRGRVEHVCPACTATMLFALQTNAPSGGAGHRTSLRGGGPLTTLIALDTANSGLTNNIWRAVWLNVLDLQTMNSLPGAHDTEKQSNIFPWLSHTRTSQKKTGRDTSPIDAHPLQMYWGMPRRIRIHWECAKEGKCDLCGYTSDRLVSHYITQNYGINYMGAWLHPLSPYRVNKDGEALPHHAQPGGISYRHWLGFSSGGESDIPALVVKKFIRDRKLPAEQLRLHAFGYDMDNMKARCWYENTFPLYSIEEASRDSFTKRTHVIIEAAINTANMTRTCIKDAWFKRPGDVKGDTAFLVEAFLNRTENAFFEQLKRLIAQLESGEDGRASLYAWHQVLSRAAMELFDYWTDRGDFKTVNPRRIVEARRKLSGWLYSKNKGLPRMLGITLDKEKAA